MSFATGTEAEPSGSSARAFALAAMRIGIGLAQGVALYLLYSAAQAKSWPATEGALFAPLTLVCTFVPIIALAAVGNLRARTLMMWLVAATALLVGLGLHDILRDPISTDAAQSPRVVSSAALWIFAPVALFIAHSLIVAGDVERRFIASYARYFDVSWMHGVQAVLALLFVGLFWALLYLGAELFRLINIDALSTLIRQPSFSVPATTLAFACAVHATDVRAGLVRGARTLTLTLLSWLLPVMALLAAAFLVALPFTGLEPLWNTRRATHVLLATAAALILLLNAAYQDGSPERPVPRALRYAGWLAALALIPLVACAAYGLSLRVRQYGWTPDRIVVVTCLGVAACYAVGYALAALRIRPWMRWLEATNVLTAFVILGVLFALFTPIADPARISVANQVGRLRAGEIAPERFDFHFLRFLSARYGRQALEELAKERDGPRAVDIAERAATALRQQNRWARSTQPTVVVTPEMRRANITRYPAGSLPESFLQQHWDTSAGQMGWQMQRCLVADVKCDAAMIDLDGDGTAEILLFPLPTGAGIAFKLVDSTWTILGSLSLSTCAGVREAVRAGRLEAVAAPLKDIEAGGQRLRVVPSGAAAGCRPIQPAPR